MFGILSNFLRPLQVVRQTIFQANYGSLYLGPTKISTDLLAPQNLSLNSIRTNIRVHFPRPNEVRRVRRHGWKKRMSTRNGRKIIMRRMLKGRYILTH